LKSLPKNVRKEALKYIKNAPACIDTPVRQKATGEQFGELQLGVKTLSGSWGRRKSVPKKENTLRPFSLNESSLATAEI
jgi:hypothetical protein